MVKVEVVLDRAVVVAQEEDDVVDNVVELDCDVAELDCNVVELDCDVVELNCDVIELGCDVVELDCDVVELDCDIVELDCDIVELVGHEGGGIGYIIDVVVTPDAVVLDVLVV